MDDESEHRKDPFAARNKVGNFALQCPPDNSVSRELKPSDVLEAAESTDSTDAEGPRWKRAVVPMMRFAAVLSGAVSTARQPKYLPFRPSLDLLTQCSRVRSPYQQAKPTRQIR